MQRIALQLLSVLVLSAVAAAGVPAAELRLLSPPRIMPLATAWAEACMAQQSDLSIGVVVSDEENGMTALIEGRADLCLSLRPMRRDERALLKARYFSSGWEAVVAVDAIELVVHPNNPVRALSVAEVRDIFNGRITNWSELGGNDERILLYGTGKPRNEFLYFRDSVLAGADFPSAFTPLADDSEVVHTVEQHTGAIGFCSLAAADGRAVTGVAIRTAGAEAILPTPGAVARGAYPFVSRVYLYMRTRPETDCEAFVQWVTGREGQRFVTATGLYPVQE